jgi:hypothetical protein
MPNYLPVGRCIYCGETKLPPGVKRFGDEHIVPLSLGGDLLLQEASCRKCEKLINKEIETPILRQEWGRFRDRLGLPTRDKASRKKRTHIPIRSIDGAMLQVPIAEHSTPVIMYKYSEARILNGLSPDTDHLRWTITVLGNHDEEMAMQQNYPQWDKSHTFLPLPDRFARFLAKIAYSYFVAEYGLGCFTPLCLDLILGTSTDYYYTVGGSLDIPLPTPGMTGGQHTFDIPTMVASNNELLIRVDIRLFAGLSTPIYHVIVGKIEGKNPQHIAGLIKHGLQGKVIIAPPNVG